MSLQLRDLNAVATANEEAGESPDTGLPSALAESVMPIKCDKPLKPGVQGAEYQYHEVAFAPNSTDTKRAHVITLNLNHNPNIRLRAYYDGSFRRIEGNQPKPVSDSWWKVYGKAAGALAILSGTFFGRTAIGTYTPYGDVIGPVQNFELTAIQMKTRDGTQVAIKNLHRCYLGFLKQEKKFRIGYRAPTTTIEGLANRFDDFIGGAGWLVHHGKDAIDVAQALYDTTLTKDGDRLWGQEFGTGADSPFELTWHTAAAVNENGKQVALIVTEERSVGGAVGWSMEQLSQWLRGEAYKPKSSERYKFAFDVYNACFFDGGGTSEIYLPHEKAHQKKPERREWNYPSDDPKKGVRRWEVRQPTCWMVVQVQ